MPFGVVIVKNNTAKVIEFFGSYKRILHPGLNFYIPLIERVNRQFPLI